MGEKLKKTDEKKVDLVAISIAERFSRIDIPLKLRKMELMKDVGLPMPETDIFKRSQLKNLHETIVHRFRPEAPLII